MFGRGYRTQSPERIIREIMRYRSGRLFFVDDNFAADVKRSERLLELMEQHRFRLPWTSQVRANIARRPELVRRMRQRRCDWVYVGFESINPESLKEMQKGQTVEDIRSSIKVFHSSGIRVHGMFMFGSDADTVEVFDTTSEFARRCHIDTVQFNVLTPLPGTRLYNRIEAEGRILHRTWRYFDGLHVVFRPRNMTPEQLQQGMVKSFRRFYTYRHAFLDGIRTGWRTFVVNVKRCLMRPALRPTLVGPIMKFFGKGLVRGWVRENRGYLRRLQQY